LLVDKKVTSFMHLAPVLNHIVRINKPLVIVAEDVEGDALNTLIINKLRGIVRVAAVKAPGFGDNRKSQLEDLAILTGGQLVSDELGLKLEGGLGDPNNPDHPDNPNLDEILGSAKKISISKDDTIIMEGAGGRKAIEERCGLLRDLIGQTTSEYEREKLQERLAKLSHGVAVLKVGGASEVEMNEKKDRVTDALCATRAAVEEGIVPGGGVALLRASRILRDTKGPNMSQDVGIRIVQNALRVPIATIASNAGVEGAVVVGKVEELTASLGYNAQTDEYVDMFKAGIIDPTKVVRTALLDATSVSSLMITAEAAVVELPKEDKEPPMPMGGGMGGMGGMF